jgi:ABC-type transporter Mla subunit MlaD
MVGNADFHLFAMDFLTKTRQAFAQVNEFAHEVSQDFGAQADEIAELLREVDVEISDIQHMTRDHLKGYIERVQGINEEIADLFNRIEGYLRAKKTAFRVK